MAFNNVLHISRVLENRSPWGLLLSPVREEGVESVGLIEALGQFVNSLAFGHAVEIQTKVLDLRE